MPSARPALVTLLAALLLSTAGVAAGAASGSSTASYAPVDRPGPALRVPVAQLRSAVICTADVRHARRNPVLLVPGTNLDPTANFAWNYERAFTAQHRPWCAVTLPRRGMDDIQIAGEYVVFALRTMAQTSGRRVAVLGYSQGGMLPRWALRFWPDTRRLVEDVVGLDPSNHGTLDAQALCQAQCPPAYWQQATGSRFLDALNSGAETFRGIDYTVVFSRTDEVVVPNLDPSGSSSLHGGAGRVANIAVQDICPADPSEHLAMGSYDAVGYALALDALDHSGPANAGRIPASVCTRPFQPGVDPATFATDFAGYVATIGAAAAASPQTPAEPPLAPYVYAKRPPAG